MPQRCATTLRLIDAACPSSSDPEYDEALAVRLRAYFPELVSWESQALAHAWRAYSQAVGLVDEEYACVLTPDFLGYLFIAQEGWPVDDGEWLTAIRAAIKILWPEITDPTYD
jgi:hypothetical protein